MSTRSGRRIHSSFQENATITEDNPASLSERKTRGKRRKENKDVTIPNNSEKRPNYVSYPSEGDTTKHDKVTVIKNEKKPRKIPLKEHNAAVSTANIDVAEIKIITAPRLTRQTRKFNNNEEPLEIDTKIQIDVKSEPALKKSKAKKKKIKSKKCDVYDNMIDKSKEGTDIEIEAVEKGKSKKQPKKKNSNTNDKVKAAENVSILSPDSFHSAAGSPLNDIDILNTNTLDTTTDDTNKMADPDDIKLTNTLEEKKERPKRQSANTSLIQESSKISVNLNTTFEKITEPTNEDILNTTFEKVSDKRHSSVNKSNCLSKSSANTSKILNNTFEKSPNNSKAPLDTTFDKTETKLNSTFDKTDSQKSSLVSSDRDTLNVTFDKSDNSNSRISITSDEDSKTEKIMNTTPVLIESSMDESVNTSKRLSEENTKKHSSETVIPQSTPLKREGTFTKDTSVANLSPERMKTVPTPGSTPFHPRPSTRSSRNDRSVLNVTRSVEKPSLVSEEPPSQTRQTRVMFCSPVNNPTVEVQQKRKVIKSSMKGSNKSFVLEETDKPRGSTRKRSLTMAGCDSLSKRRRPDTERQRSNTNVHVAPPAAAPAPPRTKLPNFAALHRARFARMESLDECQRRKAERARQLLTPSRAKPTPTGSREPPKLPNPREIKVTVTPATPKQKPATTLESLRPGFTRFGFKMHSDANPFTTSNKPEIKPKEIKPSGPRSITSITLPLLSMNGNKQDKRKESAKQIVMRERETVSKREQTRMETRTFIKGVRTNRRFELQMQMRNLD